MIRVRILFRGGWWMTRDQPLFLTEVAPKIHHHSRYTKSLTPWTCSKSSFLRATSSLPLHRKEASVIWTISLQHPLQAIGFKKYKSRAPQPQPTKFPFPSVWSFMISGHAWWGIYCQARIGAHSKSCWWLGLWNWSGQGSPQLLWGLGIFLQMHRRGSPCHATSIGLFEAYYIGNLLWPLVNARYASRIPHTLL